MKCMKNTLFKLLNGYPCEKIGTEKDALWIRHRRKARHYREAQHSTQHGCSRKGRIMEFLKVSSKSSPSSVAGAIAGMIKDGVHVEIQSVGAGAVNQAVKAIAIARGFLSPIGIEIVCIPAFADIDIDGENRTAIRFVVEPRFLRGAAAADIEERMQLGSQKTEPAFLE